MESKDKPLPEEQFHAMPRQEEEEEAEMKNMKPPPLPPPPRIRDLETGYDAGWLHANSERTSTALSPIKPNSSLFGGHRRTDTTPRSDPMAPPNVDEYQEGGRLGILRAIPADPPLPPEDVAVSSKKLASTTQLARQRKSEKMEKNGASSFPEDASLSNERIGGTGEKINFEVLPNQVLKYTSFMQENDNLRRIIMAHVVQILSDQGPYIGWKALVPISVRAMNVWQIIASLLSMKPRLDIQACAQAALSFEKRAFQRSNGNVRLYLASTRLQ
ncbi:hypothetical protein N7504_005695 [Penicillium tannophilum]|nr:hypothetical protein N7504_005695 [Penicillium tannophilum]